MTGAQEALFEKANRALEAARASVERDDVETAINRAYYAAFYAAQAALLGQGEVPKTHTGVLRQFQLHFVRAGLLAESEARTLRYAFDLRLQSDYDAFATFETQAAADLTADADRFVQAVKAMLTDA
ncbi:MAG: HEPN domain-containing protein [Rhodothermales bacterium]